MIRKFFKQLFCFHEYSVNIRDIRFSHGIATWKCPNCEMEVKDRYL